MSAEDPGGRPSNPDCSGERLSSLRFLAPVCPTTLSASSTSAPAPFDLRLRFLSVSSLPASWLCPTFPPLSDLCYFCGCSLSPPVSRSMQISPREGETNRTAFLTTPAPFLYLSNIPIWSMFPTFFVFIKILFKICLSDLEEDRDREIYRVWLFLLDFTRSFWFKSTYR